MLRAASEGLAASGIGLLSTIIAVPVAVGLQAGAIVCGLVGAGGKFIGRRLGVKARKHDQIRVLAESKLNTIADRISTALTDDKISEEEFRLILSEVDKYNQMKAEIRRGRQNQGGGLAKNEKKQLMNLLRDEAMLTTRTKLLEELQAAGNSFDISCQCLITLTVLSQCSEKRNVSVLFFFSEYWIFARRTGQFWRRFFF